MPFVSRAQQRWGHTAAGEKALGGKAAVSEWDHATPKGKAVPQYSKGDGGQTAHYAQGGSVLPRSKDWTKDAPQERGMLGKFLSTKDRFTDREADARVSGAPESQATDEAWSLNNKRHGPMAKPLGDEKSETPVKARKRGASIEGR